MEFDNSFRPGQNGRHFTEGIFTCIFMNERLCTWIKISLTCVPKSVIDNKGGGGGMSFSVANVFSCVI